jgi:hypothetical protein
MFPNEELNYDDFYDWSRDLGWHYGSITANSHIHAMPISSYYGMIGETT